MVETDRRRLISSTPQLSPEQIAQQSFPTARRGYSESDVRAYLRRVSEELVVVRDREAELLDAIDALEERLRNPQPLDESQLLDALGAETSRLLRSARDAADEMRAKAQEHADQTTEATAAEVERMRTEADELIGARTAEADERAAALVNEAEERAAQMRADIDKLEAEQRARVERETEELIEAARQQGREMLDEAKATRERVLADLFRRRALLQSQVDELRSGRDHLLDAYRVVKRTFLEATEALAQVEARAAERVTTDASGDSTTADEAGTDGDAEAAASVEGAASAEAPDDESAVSAGVDVATDPSLADVDSLFARIRAGHAEAAVAAPAETPAESVPKAADDPKASDGNGSGGNAPEVPGAVDTEPDPAAEVDLSDPADTDPAPAPLSAVDAWRARRAEGVDPLLAAVARRAKRTAQDNQNALLDAVRRHKGRPTSEQVLTPESELVAEWVGVIGASIDDAYGAGRVAVGAGAGTAEADLTAEAVATIVLPLRERIATAIDTGEDGDTGGLVERIGARFREWKNQSLENALADALAMAWSRGVYDASPDGAVLQWIPLVEGRCADCDDNGLEPTIKGESFPTGQLHPPAHPGCRCLLAPADVLSRLAANA